MSNYAPALSFSAEEGGILEVTGSLPPAHWELSVANPVPADTTGINDALQSLANVPGVDLEAGDVTVGVTIELEALKDAFAWEKDGALNNLLKHLGAICSYRTEDNTDRVLELGFRGDSPVVDVNTSFQHWLNRGITEDHARASLEAMALAFPHEIDNNFSYQPFPHSREVGAVLEPIGELEVLPREFKLHREDSAATGKIIWANMGLSVQGKPVPVMFGGYNGTRDTVLVSSKASPRLYNMYIHGWTNPRQRWGLILGMASLASAAASEHPGQADIFAGATWL